MVVDASAFLALILREPAALWVRDQLNQAGPLILMSSISYAETLLRAADRRVGSTSEIRALFSGSGIDILPVTAQLAEIAVGARVMYPLNLGDCFAYALAKQQDLPLLTLDRDFRKCDIKVIFPRIH